MKIENLGNHPVRIFGIPTDIDKIEVKDPETNSGKTPIDYPIVIPEGQIRKIGITIKSSFTEWLWRGTDISKVSLSIFANGAFNPEDANVFASKPKIRNLLPPWVTILLALAALAAITIWGIPLIKFLFFSPSSRDIFVSSQSQGQDVVVDGEFETTTPTLLKLDRDSEIEIGDSGKRHVEDSESDYIFHENGGSDSQMKEGK